tara:strand:- start:2432 stop:3898 length:1467 start_codon:yes stop_codon:yes gene_type:complete
MNAFDKLYSSTLIFEYSEKVIQIIITKFKEENPALTDDLIRNAIDRFDQVKSSPVFKDKSPLGNNKDITQYSWAQMELLIDAFPRKEKKLKNKKGGIVMADDPDEIEKDEGPPVAPILDQDGLRVFPIKSVIESIEMRRYFETQYKTYLDHHPRVSNNTITWCVAQELDRHNYYFTYAHNRHEGRTFYFVSDDRKPDESKYKLSALQAVKNDDGFGLKHYILTSVYNDGDNKEPWNFIENEFPGITAIQPAIIPIDHQQNDVQVRIVNNTIGPSDFEDIRLYEDKKFYIDAKKPLKPQTFIDMDRALKMQYINVRGMNPNSVDLIKLFLPRNHVGGAQGYNQKYLSYAQAAKVINDTGDNQLKRRYVSLINRGAGYSVTMFFNDNKDISVLSVNKLFLIEVEGFALTIDEATRDLVMYNVDGVLSTTDRDKKISESPLFLAHSKKLTDAIQLANDIDSIEKSYNNVVEDSINVDRFDNAVGDFVLQYS